MKSKHLWDALKGQRVAFSDKQRSSYEISLLPALTSHTASCIGYCKTVELFLHFLPSLHNNTSYLQNHNHLFYNFRWHFLKLNKKRKKIMFAWKSACTQYSQFSQSWPVCDIWRHYDRSFLVSLMCLYLLPSVLQSSKIIKDEYIFLLMTFVVII